jgi:hypothetical protein
MFSTLQRWNGLSNFISLGLAYLVWKSSHTNLMSETDFFLYLMRTLMTMHSWYHPLCAKTCWTCLMQLVKICINMVPTLNLMLVIMTHYFVRSLTQDVRDMEFPVIFVTTTSNKSLKFRFWKEKLIENVLTLDRLPFNSSMIMFHTWLFKNGIYLSNNVICWFHSIL